MNKKDVLIEYQGHDADRARISVNKSLDNALRVLYIDRITLASLYRAWMLNRSVLTIWHFESIEPFVGHLLQVFRRLGLLQAVVHRVENNVGQVRNDAGESGYAKHCDEARTIGARISQTQLLENPLIWAMNSEWPMEKVIHHFNRVIEEKVLVECHRIGLIGWMWQNQNVACNEQCALLIERNQWSSYLEEHARARGIRLVTYKKYWWTSLKNVLAMFFLLIKNSWKVLSMSGSTLWRKLRHLIGSARSRGRANEDSPRRRTTESTIAIRYWHRKLSFDPTERSEFFWLRGSAIPYSEIIVYGYISDKPLDSKIRSQLSTQGIRLFGHGPGIPVWRPTIRMFSILLQCVQKLTLSALTSILYGRELSLYYLRKMLILAWDYAYWRDFYIANRVRVDVGTLLASVGQVLALDSINGVSFSYQYSISNILTPTYVLSAGEDVQFVFSSEFERLWRKIDAPVNRYVHTGYIYDGVIEMLARSPRVKRIRRQLEDNGVLFVICFLDENSADRWGGAVSNLQAAEDYRYLLQWLLVDPALGIVIKPKKSSNLFQRIASVSSLVEQAKQTGRCVFLTSDNDNVVGSTIFPAEAALAADVCVGKLIGGTAALEACLAGVPTVLIDTQGIYRHPFFKWGHGNVVYDNWEALRGALEQYRNKSNLTSLFGDWSLGLPALDPFQDGLAGLRMGLYIRWIYEALKQGIPKRAALERATDQFAQRWGNEHVILLEQQ